MGNGIEPAGELNKKQQVYQKQIAATIAELLGIRFTATHPVGKPIALIPVEKHAGLGDAIMAIKSN